MKNFLVTLGEVVLGCAIVVALILGMMKDNTEDIAKASNDRYSEIYDSLDSGN